MPMRAPAAVARGLVHGTWLVLADMPRPGALGNGRSSRCACGGGGGGAEAAWEGRQQKPPKPNGLEAGKGWFLTRKYGEEEKVGTMQVKEPGSALGSVFPDGRTVLSLCPHAMNWE